MAGILNLKISLPLVTRPSFFDRTKFHLWLEEYNHFELSFSRTYFPPARLQVVVPSRDFKLEALCLFSFRYGKHFGLVDNRPALVSP